MKNIKYEVYEEAFGKLETRPYARTMPHISIEEENKMLKSILNKIRSEDMEILKEIVKLEKEIKLIKEEKRL